MDLAVLGRSAIALVLALALPALAGCDAAEPDTASENAAPSVPLGTGFDFYVLALSWSPSYCAALGDRANRQQCESRDPHAFVVHGLWPQYERGYPADCPTQRPLSVPRSLSDTMLDIMPSTGLVRHQWRKHGTCTGLSQSAYFEVTRAAHERVVIPDAFQTGEAYANPDPGSVEAAFLAANDGLKAGAVAVTCDRRFLREVRICLSKDLTGFVSCPEVDRNACALPTAAMPAAQ
ncbi:ribonuclease T2 family protein [Oricola sp.]|uniref:ribonuclease T2 family protein n=1 Tax=Oricola sp. TaxID=1979950 RepID=UPI003BAC012E